MKMFSFFKKNIAQPVEKTFVAFLFLLFSSCSIFPGFQAFAEDSAPYLLKGEIKMDETCDDYEVAGLDFYIYNRAQKEITGFTLVFYLFDEDGNPPSTGRCNVVVDVCLSVPEHSGVSSVVDITRFLSVIPDVPYTADFLYISKINYADGSEWSDPLGMFAF